MKKVLLATAVAAMAFTSCSQNEEFDEQGVNNKIEIGTIVKKTPRAVVTDNSSFKSFKLSSFIVDANQNYETNGLGTAYMDGIIYTGVKGSWSTDAGNYYWPTDKNVQFFGYSGGTSFVAPEKGYPTLSFGIGSTSDVQTDLVASAVSTAKQENNAKVNLDFKHILTKVNFSYKPEVGYTYEITELKINGVKGGNATYTFAADPTDGKWEGGSTITDGYVYPVTMGATPKDDYYTLDSENGSLMLLPQSIAANTATITITYTATKGSYTYSVENKTIEIPESTWGIGQSIRYKLALPAGEGVINVDTNVDDNWATETSNEL